jgi:hypothetical protein
MELMVRTHSMVTTEATIMIMAETHLLNTVTLLAAEERELMAATQK